MTGAEETAGTESVPSRVDEGHGLGALGGLGHAFDDLLQIAGANVMARRPYLESWAECFVDFEPWVLAVREADQLMAAAVLARRQHTAWTEIVLVGDNVARGGCLPARNVDAAESLAVAIVSRLRASPRPWRLSLRNLRLHDAVANRLAIHLPAVSRSKAVGAPLLRFDRGRELSTYASYNLRRTLQKRANRIRREGRALDVEHVTDVGKLGQALVELDALRRRRETDFRHRTRLDNVRFRIFRWTVLDRLMREAAAEITVLRIDGELVAYMIGLLDPPVYRFWETRFDPRWQRYGVGLLAQQAAAERALADPRFTALDLETGLDQHKLQLTGEIEEAEDITAWSSPAFRALDHFARDGGTGAYYRWLASYARHRPGFGKASAAATPAVDGRAAPQPLSSSKVFLGPR